MMPHPSVSLPGRTKIYVHPFLSLLIALSGLLPCIALAGEELHLSFETGKLNYQPYRPYPEQVGWYHGPYHWDIFRFEDVDDWNGWPYSLAGYRERSGGAIWLEPALPRAGGARIRKPPSKEQVDGTFYATPTGQTLFLPHDADPLALRCKIRLGEIEQWLFANLTPAEQWPQVRKVGRSEENPIRSFEVIPGTMIAATELGQGCFFQKEKDGEKIVFGGNGQAVRDVAEVRAASNDLREIGVVLSNGVEVFYDFDETAAVVAETYLQALGRYPAAKVQDRLYEGRGASRLRLSVEGPTPVIRVELKVREEQVIVWINRPTQSSVRIMLK